MDNATPPSATTETPHARPRSAGRNRTRKRREEARGYQTPDWLDRSFVLPVQASAGSLRAPMPAQARPQHDDLTATVPAAPRVPAAPHVPAAPRPRLTRISGLVRPETPTVDYAALTRRNDAGRLARRTTIAALGLAAVAALASVATGGVALTIIATGAVAAAVCTGLVALAISHAPVPRLSAPHDN